MSFSGLIWQGLYLPYFGNRLVHRLNGNIEGASTLTVRKVKIVERDFSNLDFLRFTKFSLCRVYLCKNGKT